MMGISVTAVQVKKKNLKRRKRDQKIRKKSYLMDSFIFQTVVNLDRPEEAIRTAVFLGAEQFHLFVISLPGQVLLDHCTELANNMYVFNVCIYIYVYCDSYMYNLSFFLYHITDIVLHGTEYQ